MPKHHLDQLVANMQFTEWSNNTWQMGKYYMGKPPKGVIFYTTADYTANPVTRIGGYKAHFMAQL